MNDERVIALLKESVQAVPDVPSRVSSVRSLASRQRTFARLQAVGAVASVVLVVAGITAVTRAGGREVVPATRMTAAFARARSVAFDLRATVEGGIGAETRLTGVATRDGDVAVSGDARTVLGQEEAQRYAFRVVGGVGYRTLLHDEHAPTGRLWVRVPDRPLATAGDVRTLVAIAAPAFRHARLVGEGVEGGVHVRRYEAPARDGHPPSSMSLDDEGRPRSLSFVVFADAPELRRYEVFLRVTLTLTAYDEPVAVDAPEPGVTTDVANVTLVPPDLVERTRNGLFDCFRDSRVPDQASLDVCLRSYASARGDGIACAGRVDAPGAFLWTCTDGVQGAGGDSDKRSKEPFTPTFPPVPLTRDIVERGG